MNITIKGLKMYHMHANIWFSHVNMKTEVQAQGSQRKGFEKKK